MKYYCENCGTEYNFGDGAWDIDDMCPICGNQDPDYDLLPIPDYETPDQYKKRTGKSFPIDGLVWFREKEWEYKNGTWIRREDSWTDWIPKKFIDVVGIVLDEEQMVIANPIVPPSYDWRPE